MAQKQKGVADAMIEAHRRAASPIVLRLSSQRVRLSWSDHGRMRRHATVKSLTALSSEDAFLVNWYEE